MRGRGGGTLSRGRHNHDPGVSVTCDTLSRVSIGSVVTTQRPTLVVTGSGCWISWSHTTPQQTGTLGMWRQCEGCLQCYSELTQGDTWGRNNTGCVTMTCIQGVESVPPAPSSDSGWPGLAGDTGLAQCWLQSRAGFRPGHIQHNICDVKCDKSHDQAVDRMLCKIRVSLMSMVFVSH